MPNTLINPTEITRASLAILHQKSTFLKKINRDYDDRFANSGASVSGKIGPQLLIRNPVRFTVRTGNVASIQDVVETTRPLPVSTLIGVDWEFNDVDLALTIEKFADRYLEPAMAQLSTTIENSAMLQMYRQVSNQVGTPGTTPSTLATYLSAASTLDRNLAPKGKRVVCFNTTAQAGFVDAQKGLFQSSSAIANQYEEGVVGTVAGFDFMQTENIPVHTVGPLGGTPLVNGASQGIATGWAATTSLVTDGWTAAAALRARAGDTFTIPGVFSVHPELRTSTGILQQFVVTADANSDVGGNATLIVSPAIITGGAYQTVSNAPADNAALTWVGTASTAYPINMAFHRDAYTMVTADLEVPKGMDMASRDTYENISMRFVRGFDITNNRRICRFDLLWGGVTQRPEWGCRIIG